MTPDTVRAALHAARALTGIALVACSSPSPPAANVVTIPVAPTQGTTDLGDAAPSAAPREGRCLAITDQAFGRRDPYPAETGVRVDPAAVHCCDAALSTTTPSAELATVFERHRWACCAITQVHVQGGACTPWGPPVPPPMRWRA